MKTRPEMELVGYDGNIFGIMGRASQVLKRNGMAEEAKEMCSRVTACGSYNEALNIVSEYVQTELSGTDPGILEADDIAVDPEMIPDENGVVAYIETWFDVQRRFGVTLGPDDSVDLYATVQPETDTFSASIVIKREPSGENEYQDMRLLPCERKLILDQMEIEAQKSGKSLKEVYAEWKKEYGENLKHSKNKEKKPQHDR